MDMLHHKIFLTNKAMVGCQFAFAPFSDDDLQQYLFTHTHHLHCLHVLQQNLQL